jgi:signal transduction histidine kinase
VLPERLRNPELSPTGTDVLVTLALTAAVQAEIWIWWVEAEQGDTAVAALFGLALTAPTVLRRRRPLAALGATLAVYVSWIAVAPPRGSIAPYLVCLVVTYSVASYAALRAALAGLGLAAGAEVFFVARTTNDLADYAFILVFLVGAWVAGRGMRIRQQRADALFERAVRAEVEREERARAAVAQERARIARELHDIISHTVSVMVVQAGGAEQALDQHPEQARAALTAIQQSGREARLELRRLLGLLRADADCGPGLGPAPGLTQLPALAEQVRGTGLDLTVSVEGEQRPLPPGVDLAAYRITQEALTNVVKHAGGGHASVTVRYCADAVDVEVVNGGGTPRAVAADGGHGLTGMRARAALYGGRLEHGRLPDGGYRVHARLPLHGIAP